MKLKPGAHGITLADFFTPFSQAKMAKDDLDLGSSGVLLLPDQPGPLSTSGDRSGKNGHIYVLNRDNLGGYYAAAAEGNPQVLQEISGQLRQQMGTPAYWNGRLYFGAGISPQKDGIKAFNIRNGVVSTTPTSQSAAIYHLTRSTVSVSANGNSNGIVWAVDNDAYYNRRAGPAVLHAYDARNLGARVVQLQSALLARQSGAGSKVHRADHRGRQGLRWHRRSVECLRFADGSRKLAAGPPSGNILCDIKPGRAAPTQLLPMR